MRRNELLSATVAFLLPGKAKRIPSKRVARGKLIRLNPNPGSVLAAGASVDIVVSSVSR